MLSTFKDIDNELPDENTEAQLTGSTGHPDSFKYNNKA